MQSSHPTTKNRRVSSAGHGWLLTKPGACPSPPEARGSSSTSAVTRPAVSANCSPIVKHHLRCCVPEDTDIFEFGNKVLDRDVATYDNFDFEFN